MLDKDTDDGRPQEKQRTKGRTQKVFLQGTKIRPSNGSMQKSIWQWLQTNVISKFNRRWESYFKSK